MAGLGILAIAFVDGGRGTIVTGRRRGYQQAMRELGPGRQILGPPHSPQHDWPASQYALGARPNIYDPL
jgi:hypothetical protein